MITAGNEIGKCENVFGELANNLSGGANLSVVFNEETKRFNINSGTFAEENLTPLMLCRLFASVEAVKMRKDLDQQQEICFAPQCSEGEGNSSLLA